MAEDRQAEGRLGNEDMRVLDRFELGTGRIPAAFVVAGKDHAQALVLDHDLRRAEDVARRGEPDRDAIDLDRLAIFDRLCLLGETVAITRGHDGQRVGMGEHFAMAAARMIGMAVADDGPVHRAAHRVQIEIARRAIEAFGGRVEQEVWPQHACNVGGVAERGRGWVWPLPKCRQLG